jgi:hypothetical protein
MPEVALVYGDDYHILSNESSYQPTDPESLLIVGRVSVLDIGLLNSLVLKVELVRHDLPQSYCRRYLLFR